MLLFLALVLISFTFISISGYRDHVVEEFHVYGPTELHDAALTTFLEMRKEHPNLNYDDDSPFVLRAKNQAINRMSIRSDEELLLRVRA